MRHPPYEYSSQQFSIEQSSSGSSLGSGSKLIPHNKKVIKLNNKNKVVIPDSEDSEQEKFKEFFKRTSKSQPQPELEFDSQSESSQKKNQPIKKKITKQQVPNTKEKAFVKSSKPQNNAFINQVLHAMEGEVIDKFSSLVRKITKEVSQKMCKKYMEQNKPSEKAEEKKVAPQKAQKPEAKTSQKVKQKPQPQPSKPQPQPKKAEKPQPQAKVQPPAVKKTVVPPKALQVDESSSQEQEQQQIKPTKKNNSKKVTEVVKETKKKEPVATKPTKTSKPAQVVDQGEYQICVKNLSFKADEDQVTGVFNQCGDITRLYMPKDDKGRHRGLCFITYKGKKAFEEALGLSGSQICDRPITVQKSQGRKDQGDKKKQAGNNKPIPAISADMNTVFIGNISFKATKEKLQKVFSKISTFKEVRIITDRESGKMKGYGYAEFYDANGVKAAIKLSGTPVEGRELNINPAEPRKRDGGGDRSAGKADNSAKKGFAQQFQGQVEYL